MRIMLVKLQASRLEGGGMFLKTACLFYVFSLFFYSPIFVVLVQELWFEHPAILALADGTIFKGTSIGASGKYDW